MIIATDVPTRSLMCWALEQEGFEVELASTPGEAARMASATTPDVIVVNTDLTDRELRRDVDQLKGLVPGVKVLSLARASQASKGRNIGAEAQLTKPFDADELIERVKALLDSGADAA